ncbi:MAG: hypothetical protein D6733_05320 [Methanobacteriota archaeon]|nr:MAG: hypothetical protein D6733_05320 [Euryarchaeota archaeon]
MLCAIATAALSAAAAQGGKAVILVSDNEADSAVAAAIQNVKNIDIVTTPWGEYNDSVVAEIEALKPDTIFIIGGPMAVPSQYEISLSTYTIIRISGPDRYATSAAALEHFKGDFKGKGIVVAYGHDSKGIEKALEKAKRLGGIVLFVKPDDVPDDVERALNESEAETVEVVESPDMDDEEIGRQMNKTKAKKVKLEKLNESDKQERALEQIEEAKEKIGKAEKEIGERNITNSTANKLLEEAKRHLANAEDAYANGSYGEAFGQAVSAEHIAENAKRKAKHEDEKGEKKGDDEEEHKKKKTLDLGSQSHDGREEHKVKEEHKGDAGEAHEKDSDEEHDNMNSDVNETEMNATQGIDGFLRDDLGNNTNKTKEPLAIVG